MKNRLLFLIFCLFTSAFTTQAQKPKTYTSSEILQSITKLQNTGTVMFVAAHPDDENTRLISYLANERKVETIYLSVTRGDGGQNLIGPEIRELLGIIRTQELLQARRTDGGRQYFTRASDFGFSKDAYEALSTWDKQQVLSDVVWAIRKFRPDVIINRFDTEPSTTHGHHTASAMLSVEAFDLAADPNAFPEQLKYVETWQPKRIFWNTYNWDNSNSDYEGKPNVISYDVGTYNPLLGKSYNEIAAESRTMHKSQGFGSTGSRGSALDHVVQLKGDKAVGDIFSDMDISWNRIAGGENINAKIEAIINEFQIAKPEASLASLIALRKEVKSLAVGNWWANKKLDDLDEIIRASAGIYIEAISNTATAVGEEQVEISLETTNRSNTSITVRNASINGVNNSFNKEVAFNRSLNEKFDFKIPANFPISQPYWLVNDGTVGMYDVPNQEMRGMPENPPAFMAEVEIEIMGEVIPYTIPVVYKRNDPVDGEQYRPFIITPPVYVGISDNVVVFSDNSEKEVSVEVIAGKDNVSGQVSLDVPSGWSLTPNNYQYDLKLKGEQASFIFKVNPPTMDSDVIGSAVATYNGKSYNRDLLTIDYPHIPFQTIFPESKARMVKINLEKRGELIGYIQGAGDDIPRSLRQIGYQVEEINPDNLKSDELARYDAIIMGVRAYNTVDALRFGQTELFKYVENGGTLMVQYNTNSRLVTNELAPYSLRLSRDRITVEEAEVQIIAPEHPVMNFPNKITTKDFEKWVQERGLYFPGEWDKAFTPIIASADPGEEPLTGGLLVAKYGKGHYIYSGYSWFRQLPAGVPGAFRIFANLISIGSYEENP
ncbi:PIG-L family deacetylase [Fulvivirgaceae bacterium LMO-SS25]